MHLAFGHAPAAPLPRRSLLRLAAAMPLAALAGGPAWALDQLVLPAGARAGAPVRLRVFGFDIYDAQLWAAPGFEAAHYARHGFALELRYLRAFKGAAIAERSLQEMRRIAAIPREQGAVWLAALRQLLPDVRHGERLTGVHRPGQAMRLWLDGRLLGQVDDPAFAPLFFGIWLHPATSEPAMRQALLDGVPP